MTDHPLNVEVHGPSDGPPLVLLHGWGSTREDMRPIAEALSDTYRSHVLDLPGHGSAPPPPRAWGVPEHATAVHDYIDSNIGTSVSLIGHSNGGRIGLYMASSEAHKNCVNRLILISPSGVEPQRSWSYYAKSGIATALRAPVRALPEVLREPAEDWLRHTIVWRALGSSDYNAQQGVMRETFVKTVNLHLDGQLSNIDVPTLIFWGTEDDAVSERQMKVIETTVDNCGLVTLDGAGHYAHLERPRRVVSAIRHFLENSSPGSR